MPVSSETPSGDASTVERRRWDDSALRRDGPRPPYLDDLEGARIRARSRALLFGGASEPVRLGRLELVARIGAGGMGEVYAARDAELDREVAVKIVRSDIDADRGDATARILREAQLMARLTHPNVVRIYDVGRVESRVYITMEYVRGTTLSAWLEQAPRPWREILDRFLRAGRGLAAAHRMGLVHRDFKPANVLVGADGRVLVADFGLARTVVAEPGAGETNPAASAIDSAFSPTSSASRLPVTERGAVLGTPGYMSPEQLNAAPVDARSDLFSFCVALYEALYGVRPFAGPTAAAILANIEAGTITPPARAAGVPARVARVLTRGLAGDPARRFATMNELLADLERAASRPRRRAGVALSAAAGLVIAGAVADLGLFADADPCAAARGELAAVWNDEREQALRASFAATGLTFADAASERVSARLDAYAAAWTGARVDACEAAQVHRSQSPLLFDLRMVCLERRERALRTLVDTLVAADRSTVQEAVDSAATLPAIEPCSAAESLVRTLPPPEDPETALAVARARELLARGEAQRTTGHYSEGLALADDAAARTATLAHEPAHAEALALRGRILGHMGDLAAAEATLLDAAELAEASRHDELASDVWLDLMRLANQHLVDPTRGEAWIRRARAAQRRLGDLPARRVQVLAEQGFLHYRQRRFEESERALRTALALEEAGRGDALVLGKLTHNLANTLEARGRLADAQAAYDRALTLMQAALGPDHPEVARVVHDLGTFLTTRGELEQARERLASALAIATRAHGLTHPVTGHTHIALAQVALHSGDFAGASAHAEAATQIFREALAVGHPDHVDAALVRGAAHFFGGELDAALAAFVTARELQRTVASPDPLVAAIIAVDIAETQLALSRLDEARATFAEVEQILADASVSDLDLEARVLTGRGEIALAGGDARAALPLLEAALALRRRLPDDPLALAELHAALVRARGGPAPRPLR